MEKKEESRCVISALTTSVPIFNSITALHQRHEHSKLKVLWRIHPFRRRYKHQILPLASANLRLHPGPMIQAIQAEPCQILPSSQVQPGCSICFPGPNHFPREDRLGVISRNIRCRLTSGLQALWASAHKVLQVIRPRQRNRTSYFMAQSPCGRRRW